MSHVKHFMMVNRGAKLCMSNRVRKINTPVGGKRGYTLIEILIVISIIGFIASVAMYFLNSARESGRIAGLLQFSNGVESSLADDLVAYWSFDSGDATDSWGQYHGTVDSGVSVNNDGIVNGAMSFNGSINAKITTSLGFSEINYFWTSSDNAYTTSAWFKDSGSSNGVITGASGGIGDFVNYVVFINSNQELRVKFLADDNLVASGVSDGKWHHVVVAWDGTSMYAYFDGKKQALVHSVGSNQKINFSIGSTNNGTSYHFNGLIDEVKVYSEGLSLAQVQKLYAEGAEKFKIAVK